MDTKPTEIVTRTAKVRIAEHGVVWVGIFPGAEQTLEDAKSNVDAVRQLVNDGVGRILVDMRQVKSMSRDARVYYSGAESARVSRAIAMLVSAPISRLVGNFLLSTFNDRKNNLPLKMFGAEDEAYAWLLGFELPSS